eukprot:1489804-Rhodomonas_salina.1
MKKGVLRWRKQTSNSRLPAPQEEFVQRATIAGPLPAKTRLGLDSASDSEASDCASRDMTCDTANRRWHSRRSLGLSS